MSSLAVYHKKRDFNVTPEPPGKKDASAGFRFVVQRHEASRLHYDFRLELDGVLKSWAVPKGPSMNTGDKRFAVMTEDHPVDYLGFHGKIPEGNYGAGKMVIWDKGMYFPVNQENERITERQALQWMKKGELKFILKGKKIQGGFVLIRLRNDDKNWLLIKHKDEYAVTTKYDSEDYVRGARSAKATPKKKSSVRKIAARAPGPKRTAAKKNTKTPANVKRK